MTPYYDDGRIQIYHGDCREILPTIDPSEVWLVLTDPPYGIAYKDRTGRIIEQDDQPFDPAPLLTYEPGEPRTLLTFSPHPAVGLHGRRCSLKI